MTCLIKTKSTSPSLRTASLKLTSSLLRNSELETEQAAKVLSLVFSSKHFLVDDVCQFCRQLKKWTKFVDVVTPKVISYFEGAMISSGLDAEGKRNVIFMLCELVVDNISFEEGYSASMFEEAVTFDFPKVAAMKGTNWWRLLFEIDWISVNKLEITWTSLVILPFIR